MDQLPQEQARDGKSPADRRREPRYPLEANVIVRKENGESISGRALDISSSGMHLELSRAGFVEAEDLVTVEVELPDDPGKPFSSWGIGRVAHVNARRTGVELYAGHFAGADPGNVAEATEEESL